MRAYADCPAGTIPANEDAGQCIDTKLCEDYAPMGSLITELPFRLTCSKVGLDPLPSGKCPQGYLLGRSGVCYADCAPGLLENGLLCLKRSIPRPYASYEIKRNSFATMLSKTSGMCDGVYIDNARLIIVIIIGICAYVLIYLFKPRNYVKSAKRYIFKRH